MPSSNHILRNHGHLWLVLILEWWGHPVTWLFRFPLWNSVWSVNFPRCISEERWLGFIIPFEYKSPTLAPWWAIDLRQFLSSRLFPQLFQKKKQGKYIGCNGSSLRQISWIIVWFFRHSSGKLTIKNASEKTHILSCISLKSGFAAGLFGTRGNKSLMWNVSTAKTARWVTILEVFQIFNKF